MSANVAVILGISQYDSLVSLPGCDVDTKALNSLLKESEKFSDILFVNGAETYAVVKKKLVEFFRKYDSEPVDELLFYFSGHGDVIDDEFRFLLRDFDENKPNATSISNADLDEWARSVKPKLCCKIVDACRSAVSYIKEPDALRRIFEKNRESFQSCYFFFSSQQDQSSFADKELSHFTRAIIESIVSYPEDSIGYNDLASALADHFRSNAEQTPYFVHQGNFTEVFLDISPRIRDLLGSVVGKKESDARSDQSERPTASLEDRVRSDAQRYLAREEAVEFLDSLRDSLQKKNTFSGEVKGLYDCKLEELDDISDDVSDGISDDILVGKTDIATWLIQRRESSFFAEVEYDSYYTDLFGNELEDYEVRSLRIWAGMEGAWTSRRLCRKKKRAYEFRLLETGSWKMLRLIAQPRYHNVPKWELQLSYVMGPTEVVVFCALTRFRRSRWDSYEATGQINWTIERFSKEKIRETDIGERLFDRFEQHLSEGIAKQFGTT